MVAMFVHVRHKEALVNTLIKPYSFI